MDKITDLSIKHCTNSRFVQPYRVEYKQDGKARFWDCTKVHDSVAVLIYNKTKKAFVFVKQFRPAVYMNKHKLLWENSDVFSSPLSQKPPQPGAHDDTQSTSEPVPSGYGPGSMGTSEPVSSGYGPGSMGCTYELCAGIIDKAASLEQITKEEILEETGYDAPLANIRLINSYYSSVGHSGSHQTLFYCEVADSMLVGGGGGNDHEGEMIDVVHVPVDEAMKIVFDGEMPKSTGFCFALLWFEHFMKNKT